MFLKGMKRHISEMGERGVSNRTIAQYEQDLTTLEQQNAEVDKIRAELNAKVKVMNETLMTVKETYTETKKVIKGYYPKSVGSTMASLTSDSQVIYATNTMK